MKPHPRIRKTIKWGGAAVTVLLVVVWVGSAAWHAEYRFGDVGDGWEVWSVNGYFVVARSQQRQGTSEDLQRLWRFWWEMTRTRFNWWPAYAIGSNMFFVPGWMVVSPIAAIAGVAWMLDRRAHRRLLKGCCPKCGYDRTGLPMGGRTVCPECGAAPGA